MRRRQDFVPTGWRDNDWLRLTSDDRRGFGVVEGSVTMRRFLLAAMVFGTAAGAHAADMPDYLRGGLAEPTPTRNWDGWYAGGQVGYSSANMDFSQSLVGLTNFIYRDSVLEVPTSQLSALGKANPQATGFGAFVGRNYQWDDLVFGDRGQLQLHQRPHRFFHLFNWAASIQLSAWTVHACKTTLPPLR